MPKPRQCAQCNRVVDVSGFSKNQWSNKPIGTSKCRACVEGREAHSGNDPYIPVERYSANHPLYKKISSLMSNDDAANEAMYKKITSLMIGNDDDDSTLYEKICSLGNDDADNGARSVCTRCHEEFTLGGISDTNDACQIPHPEYLQSATMSTYGPDGRTHEFSCQACDQEFTKSVASRKWTFGISGMPITAGAKLCYQGPHTTKEHLTVSSELRRVHKDAVTIHSGPDMQAIINALDGDETIRVLHLSADGNHSEYDQNGDISKKTKFAIRLPNLEEFYSRSVDLGKLEFTPALTPKLRKITIHNPTQDEDPQFIIDCPELRDFSCDYFEGKSLWLNKMLQRATKLESFDSYKLLVRHLSFASNHLKSIRLHRPDLLGRIDVWAPRLKKLDLQAAWDIQEIHFLPTHPTLARDLPPNFVCPDELVVSTMNVNVKGQALAALRAHPRVYEDPGRVDAFDY
jgi:hypothetical protein